MDKVKEKVEKIINEMSERELEPNDIDMLGKLVDIHKDLSNEKYWEVKEMYYRDPRRYDYDRDDMNYGRGRKRDSRGRYKGHDMIDDMSENYGRYMETRDGRSYGGKEDSIKSLDYMMQSTYDFICMLEEEANTDEEMNIIRKYARKISEL